MTVVPPSSDQPDRQTQAGGVGGDTYADADLAWEAEQHLNAAASDGATDGVSTAPPASAAPVSGERARLVADAVRGWQRQLVDVGGPNTLLWYRDLPSGTLDLTTAHPGGVSMLMAGRSTHLSDLVREPSALEEARRRARVIRTKTVELLEERGVVSGFMAIGMATWTLPGSQNSQGGQQPARAGARQPMAPVLLRPCTLRPTNGAQQNYELDLGPEVELNPVLVNYLATEWGITLDPDATADLAHVTRLFDPAPVFRELTRRCAQIPGFRVIDRKVVGTFSYTKLPMVADLAAFGDGLADHDVIAALAGDDAARAELGRSHSTSDAGADAAGATGAAGAAGDGDLAGEMLVLDADSSQQAVVEAARAGANLVVQGAPGTGKSQTVANLVAALAADGKSVLFVTQKRAAIEAVTSRLSQVGLGDLVFDGYDGAPDRRALAHDVVAVMDRAHAVGRATSHTVTPDSAARTPLETHRHQLADHRVAMHEVRRPSGASIYEAQCALAALAALDVPPASRVRLRGDVLAGIPRDRVAQLAEELRRIADHDAWPTTNPDATAAQAAGDPWYGARITDEQQRARALDLVTTLTAARLADVRAQVDATLRTVGLPESTSPADAAERLDLVGDVQQVRRRFLPEVWEQPIDDYLDATGDSGYRAGRSLTGHAPLGWWARVGAKRDAKALVKPEVDIPDLHAALLDIERHRARWAEYAGSTGELPPALPSSGRTALPEVRATLEGLLNDLTWLGGTLTGTQDGGDLVGAGWTALAARISRLAGAPERLAVLPAIVPALDRLDEAGLRPLVDDLAARGVPGDRVADELDLVWWASVLDDIAAGDRRIGAHNGVTLRSVVAEYRRLDLAHLAAGAVRVRDAVRARLLDALEAHPEQERSVRAEAAKTRRHLATRELFPQARDVLTAAKPCWAISPLTVAAVLPPERAFDVVIVDEAGQISTAQAISAIARARQVVVLGDDQQLSPTSFSTTPLEASTGASAGVSAHVESARRDASDSAGSGAAGSDAGGSILDALGGVLPTRTLDWHYRSRDERLIAFANHEIYDDRLVTFPGTAATSPVRLDAVGPAEGMSVADPEDEVARVVELVMDHARRRPSESLGVVTLTHEHADRLAQAIFAALDLEVDPEVIDFFDPETPERFFVKNVERAQGDERDAIILSIGYGPDASGRMPGTFGALSTDGGERRLAVAVSRARARLTVVSRIGAGDLSVGEDAPRGVRLLGRFIDQAAAEPATESDASDALSDAETESTDPLMRELAQRLRLEGFTVHENFGASRQRLDLAVEDPYARGRMVVAVESDGGRYAAQGSTRERERLRADQFDRLGWQYVRVWDTDVFRDPARDVARVVEAVRSADSRSVWGSTK